MINFEGKKAVQTNSNVAALSSGSTIYMHFRLGDLYATNAERTLFYHYLGFRMYVDKLFSTNALQIIHTGSTQDGWWSVALPSFGLNVDIQLALTYDFSAGAPAAPVVWGNGKALIVTEITAPVGTVAIGAAALTIGGMALASSYNSFKGFIGEWGVKVGTKLTAAQMERLTSTRMMRQPLQYGFTHYYPMDEASDGEVLITATRTIVPDSDIQISWSTAGSHWDKIDADDAEFIKADKNDDDETEIYGVDTSGISLPRTIRKVLVGVKLNQESGIGLGVNVYMDGAWQDALETDSDTGVKTNTLTFHNLTNGGWVLASMQLSLTSQTMSDTDEVVVYYLYAICYYGPLLRDYVAGNNLRYGDDAVGVTNRYLSY